MIKETLREWGPEAQGRTAAGLRELQLALLYQLLQAPLPARKPARNPRCNEQIVPVILTRQLHQKLQNDSAQQCCVLVLASPAAPRRCALECAAEVSSSYGQEGG